MKDPTARECVDPALRRWLRLWSLASIPGAALAMLTWGVSTVLLVSLLPAMMGGAVQAMVLTTTRGFVTPRELNRACIQAAVAAALLGASVCAIGSLSTAAAFAVVLALGLTSPCAARRLTRAVGSGARPSKITHEELHAVPPLLVALLSKPAQEMTNQELCRAWRRSFVALEQTGTLAQKAVLVQLRQCYLDEIETRDALALRAWLSSGARAAGGPDRFLDAGGSHREGPEAA